MKNLKIDKKIVSQRIHDLRTKLGLTQKDVADTLGYSTMAISKYESGKSNLSDESATALAKVLKVSVFELLYGDIAKYTKQAIENIEFKSSILDDYVQDDLTFNYLFGKTQNDKLFIQLDKLFSYIIDNYKPRFDLMKKSSMNMLMYREDEISRKDHANWRLAVIEFTTTSEWFTLLVRDLKAGLSIPFNIQGSQSIQDRFQDQLLFSINHLLSTDIDYQNPDYRPIYKRLDYLINKTEYNAQLDLPEGAGGSIGDSSEVANCYWEFESETQAYFKKLDEIKARYRAAISEKDNS
ncbi:MAG: helix-turn-helix transcriptional regulator [Oenococcus sp.]|uniref:HTH cro/C1-type domain-containing protein n=1 Tax=Oenococcus oeni TaxID=1247 RepID=A0AAQ2UV54_OENOE|nr:MULTISPECIES: helix-turn-helix transcriptional regulator [Oenococcus]MCV3297013.1 helix-turn-helix domain-containing protein [Oenococcus kitaharae]SYW07841.1 hypothetical protein OENI_90044 [Oenococcus oeni]VDB97516.1 protein of unknown function [Oenococcus oeni]VDK14904.1 hypothetical protein OAL24_01639 [Oenococcus sicerae]